MVIRLKFQKLGSDLWACVELGVHNILLQRVHIFNAATLIAGFMGPARGQYIVVHAGALKSAQWMEFLSLSLA